MAMDHYWSEAGRACSAAWGGPLTVNTSCSRVPICHGWISWHGGAYACMRVGPGRVPCRSQTGARSHCWQTGTALPKPQSEALHPQHRSGQVGNRSAMLAALALLRTQCAILDYAQGVADCCVDLLSGLLTGPCRCRGRGLASRDLVGVSTHLELGIPVSGQNRL